jgi:hypothetical protein
MTSMSLARTVVVTEPAFKRLESCSEQLTPILPEERASLTGIDLQGECHFISPECWR